MIPKVKICGNTQEADVRMAIAAGADYLGLIFAESKRHIDLDQAKILVDAAPDFKHFVGVFYNQPREEVEKFAQALKLRYLQFHGEETAHYCAYFMRQGHQVIKVFRVKDAMSLKRIAEYDVDYFMLDTYVTHAKGGSGVPFDWKIIEDSPAIHQQLFLSGGLQCNNLAKALETVRPFAVDVASGVESSPGQKSAEKVREFIRIAKWQGVQHVPK